LRGFAAGDCANETALDGQGETVETAKKRLLKDAYGFLAEDIRITVKSETNQQSLSKKVNKVEQLETSFKSDVQTAASAEMAGIHSEPPYHDAATGLIYAFVYVKRADLAAFYRNQINLDLNKAEIAVGVAEQLKAAGKLLPLPADSRRRKRQRKQPANPTRKLSDANGGAIEHHP